MKIDAMGMACPKPVILTKRAIRESGEEVYTVMVDNFVATENLAKMGVQLGYASSVNKISEGEYEVTLTKTEKEAVMCNIEDPEEYIVVYASDGMGDGDPDFCKTLVESFTFALTEQDVLPAKVICYNKGIFLTTENEKTVADLKTLEEKGVEVLSCGLCLDFYGKKEDLKVGSISNMYRIVELMRTYRVVKPW